MRWIMNSAMVPCAGRYERTDVSRAEAAEWLRAYVREARSTVGYPATAQHIADLCGVRPAISREQTTMEPGDEALVVKLRYRVQDPGQKGAFAPGPEDWEYCLVRRLS